MLSLIACVPVIVDQAGNTLVEAGVLRAEHVSDGGSGCTMSQGMKIVTREEDFDGRQGF